MRREEQEQRRLSGIHFIPQRKNRSCSFNCTFLSDAEAASYISSSICRGAKLLWRVAYCVCGVTPLLRGEIVLLCSVTTLLCGLTGFVVQID